MSAPETDKSLTHGRALRLMAALDEGSNMFGPLSPEIRARLYAVAENPTQETWDDAHGIILDGQSWTTLWQALIRHTSYAVTHGPGPGEVWLPTSQQIVLAIREVLT